MSFIKCPVCKSTRVFYQRRKTLIQKVVGWWKDARMMHCTACGWTGWGPPLDMLPPEEYSSEIPPAVQRLVDDTDLLRAVAAAGPGVKRRETDPLRIGFTAESFGVLVSAPPRSIASDQPPPVNPPYPFDVSDAATDAVTWLADLAQTRGWWMYFLVDCPFPKREANRREVRRWLVEHGIAAPRVLAVSQSCATTADALNLDYFVDVDAARCVTVEAQSKAKAILVLRRPEPQADVARLHLTPVQTLDQALTALVEIEETRGASTGLDEGFAARASDDSKPARNGGRRED